MARYRFSWDAFGDQTVLVLAEALGFDQGVTDGSARDYLDRKRKRPNDGFVRATKHLLVQHWLPESEPRARVIVARLRDMRLGPMNRPSSLKGYQRYVDKCRNSKRLRATLLDALLRCGDADRKREDGFTPRFGLLRVAQQERDPREPYQYQKDAWEKLDAQLAESDSTGIFRGLLVMPTGAGKTFTAVRWLVERVLSRGMRVLWLAHRHELLRHAAVDFHREAGRVTGVDVLRVRIVSGQHCGTTQIDPADHVVLASVASLARRPDIRDEVLAQPDLFVVVDEAHHSAAKSYKDIIRLLQKQKKNRILGLTATPTRTIKDERPILSRLYGGRILYQVGLRKLIERGTLSRPKLVRVQTESDVEEGITNADRAHFDRFNDLSEDWLNRIAELTSRNKVIIGHYLDNRKRYAKTLIFAINVHHAALLAEQFRAQKVRAQYIASYRPDNTDGDPMAVIQAFRDDELDVLINVQMVTEGVDVPSIKTVFLTRPTGSEILVRQMIGRALRGPKASGTAEAFIVSFEDHWEKYRDWESPFDLVPDVVAAAEEKQKKAPTVRPALIDHLPWDIIRATSARMRDVGIDMKADAFEAVPHGWYVLEREIGEEAVRHVIAVYEHQRACFEAMFDHLDGDKRRKPSVRKLFAEFFGDCDDPKAADRDVLLAVRHFALGGERPEFVFLADRELHDPYAIAEKVTREDLGEKARKALFEERYTSLAKAIYPTRREYRSAIEDALHELSYPADSTRIRRAVPVFDPGPDHHLAPGPAHELDVLMEEVLDAGATLLGVRSLPHSGTVEWSGRILKGWCGKAYFDGTTPAGHGQIIINVLLNSPDLSANTIRLLLWHEYLHLYLKCAHTDTFNEKEKLWPGYRAADHELDSLDERFEIQYW